MPHGLFLVLLSISLLVCHCQWVQLSFAQPAPGTVLRVISAANLTGTSYAYPFNSVAVSPFGLYAYATDEGSSVFTVLLSNLTVTASAFVPVGVAEGLATSPTSGDIFVGSAPSAVVRLRPNLTVVASYSPRSSGSDNSSIVVPQLGGVDGVAVAADGQSFYCASGYHSSTNPAQVVLRVHLNGSVLQSIAIEASGGVAVDSRGNVYTAGLTNLTSFDSSGRQTATSSYPRLLDGHAGIAIDAAFNLYVATGSALLVYTSNLTLRANLSANLVQPNAVAIAPNGTLVVADRVLGVAVVQGMANISAPVIGVRGDPSCVGLRGQSFQVHGVDGAVYALLSSETLQVNGRFTFLSEGRCPVLDGKTQGDCWVSCMLTSACALPSYSANAVC